MVSYQPTMLGTRYMCSAGHYLASRAGFDILEAGGNAVDAGVAAAMSLAVLQSDIVNVGGVAPMIIYLAEKDEVDKFIERANDPTWWRKINDELNNKEIKLSKGDLDMLKSIRKGQVAHKDFKLNSEEF